MSLIGSAIRQVYVSNAADANQRGDLGRFTVDVMSKLAVPGAGPLVAVGIVAASAFGVIFDEGWERAGLLVAWMTPWFVKQFLASLVSMSLHVTGRQRAAMTLQLSGFVARITTVWLASKFWGDSAGEAYALSGFAVYSAYLVVVMKVVGGPRERWWEDLATAAPWVLPWAAAATILGVALRACIDTYG